MRADSQYLQDIFEAASDIEEFLVGVTIDDFRDSKTVRWAVVQRLGVIGEGAARLSNDLKEHYSEIEWQLVIGMRNVLVHAYFNIDWDIIWIRSQLRSNI